MWQFLPLILYQNVKSKVLVLICNVNLKFMVM